MDQQKKVSLKNMAEGAAIERFDLELERVLLNIADPNTADGPRQITLTVTLAPNEDRSFCRAIIDCKSKVGSLKKFSTNLYIGYDEGSGEMIATEYNPKQERMDFSGKAHPAVAPLKAV